MIKSISASDNICTLLKWCTWYSSTSWTFSMNWKFWHTSPSAIAVTEQSAAVRWWPSSQQLCDGDRAVSSCVMVTEQSATVWMWPSSQQLCTCCAASVGVVNSHHTVLIGDLNIETKNMITYKAFMSEMVNTSNYVYTLVLRMISSLEDLWYCEQLFWNRLR